jgi:hypothetical protein
MPLSTTVVIKPLPMVGLASLDRTHTLAQNKRMNILWYPLKRV